MESSIQVFLERAKSYGQLFGQPEATAERKMSTTDGNKDTIDTLRALYSQVLGVAIEEVDADLSFVALGGNERSLLN